MCGLAGFWDTSHRFGAEKRAEMLQNMTRALRHRGPDDEGSFLDAPSGLAIGHRRLSVVDLSPEGHQPMTSAGGRFVMAFNGEVYNHRRLRQPLERAGACFRGHSDTEVMLAAIEHWGLEEAVSHFIGMFAFALWDRETRRLTLVRDRLGIKPLYYGWVGSLFVFGSELKAVATLPGFAGEVDRDALCLLLRHDYINAPYSIYRDMHKLPPGTWLTIDADLARSCVDRETLQIRTHSYWSARAVAEHGAANRLELSDAEAAVELDRLLRDAVALRMEADVPLGAFLSGGVDSSLVVALMQAQSARPVRTFSIGFHEEDHDEARHASAVARHLGTDHTELYLTAQDALDVVPQLPSMYDEPFSDSSQIPTYLVSKLAREQVTVSLSGDGGDELFAGYPRYFKGKSLARWANRIPQPLRRSTARLLQSNIDYWVVICETANRCVPPRLRLANPRARFNALAMVFDASTDEERYRMLVSHSRDPASIVLGGNEPSTELSAPARQNGFADLMEYMMLVDLVSYLPGDILTKVDRASMAVSLETRVPLLDHRVVEFAWRIPMRQKIREKRGKWLLRQVLYGYVPPSLIDRPKHGFGVPIQAWLRGPLREWAESLLDEQRLREEGYFNPEPIRRMWADHLAGRARHAGRLWDVLMFQAWLSHA